MRFVARAAAARSAFDSIDALVDQIAATATEALPDPGTQGHNAAVVIWTRF